LTIARLKAELAKTRMERDILKKGDGVFRDGVCVLTIETIKTQLVAAKTAAAADRRTLSSLVTKILNDWLKANSL
jgi:hypothetical protein